MADIRYVDSIGSTNSAMVAGADSYGHGDVLCARSQTAGRGQRGNTWQSEPGKNLTFSLMLRPRRLKATDAFLLSMLVSNGIVDALAPLLPGLEVEVKWPNDIYVGNGKLAGILIENSLSGPYIERSVVGVGLNVNQASFPPMSLHPVSMAMISGRNFDLEDVLNVVADAVVRRVDGYSDSPDTARLLADYHARLWRRHGEHLWRDNLRGEVLSAPIREVSPDGHLILGCSPERIFDFKEVAAIID